ncbi:metallophosphoesterase [Aliikangiella coralliicola]|uniref:Calcineurin-like phosphoesterase domain-containing protein n=1 Tax=Aliikangiella coralliicola TaxID=2592383 RepID=A0A545UJJ8_9GAMM|nr:metallophosphoesterase [Aliikangiella coralliicola]TQV89645.1 hypothetical protein FLL46_01820 [Aliikangiella coralliicola]
MMKKIIRIVFVISSLACSVWVSADNQVSFETESPIYVVGDIHGAYTEIHATLRQLKLIDEQDKWIGGSAHFVSLGDLMDRGPATRKVIDLFMRLQVEAIAAGGRFHIVAGNHEVMNLIGDLRYVSDEEIDEFAADETDEIRQAAYQKYLKVNRHTDNEKTKAEFDQQYRKGFFAQQLAYQPTSHYGKWLMELPYVIKINEQIFAHGGLSKNVNGKSLEELNEELKETLSDYLKSWLSLNKGQRLAFYPPYKQRDHFVKPLKNSRGKKAYTKSKKKLLLSKNSPTWYRGNAICHPYFESDNLKRTLKQWDATRLWVGHTTSQQRKPLDRLDGQLIILDTGMLKPYYKGEPWAAKIDENNEVTFINGLTGETASSITAPNREWANPYDMSDSQVEEFLTTAKMTHKKGTKEGITKPFKVTLEKEGKVIKGIFKYKDSYPDIEKGGWNKGKDKADRYQYEVAAYKLDRMLGIGLVPVTVERTIEGRKGALQLWVDGLISDLVMNEEKIYYNGYCNPHDQVNLMDSFDYLIMNTDRNQSNIMYQRDDWQIVFIDHSKSFGTSVKRPKILKRAKIILTDKFKSALEELTYEQLQTLKPWLHTKQIRMLWKRRNKMLKGKF